MAGLIAAALTAIVGGAVAATRKRKAKKEERREKDYQLWRLGRQEQQLDRWYGQNRGKDYVDSDEAQNTLRLLRQEKERADRSEQNDLVRSGSTAEARIAKAAQNNKIYSEGVAGMAAQSDALRKEMDEAYWKRKRELEKEIESYS